MQVRAARNLVKYARAELDHEPKLDSDQIRRTLDTFAVNVEEQLGQY